jgi:hypothetical protein
VDFQCSIQTVDSKIASSLFFTVRSTDLAITLRGYDQVFRRVLLNTMQRWAGSRNETAKSPFAIVLVVDDDIGFQNGGLDSESRMRSYRNLLVSNLESIWSDLTTVEEVNLFFSNLPQIRFTKYFLYLTSLCIVFLFGL